MDRYRAAVRRLRAIYTGSPDVPASYAIRRHTVGNGRKDILTLGEPDSTAPFLRVEIYRPGNQIGRYADPVAEMILSADALGPVEMQHLEKPLATKFGPLTLVPFVVSKGTPRRCLGFVRAYDNPRMQLSGWFCQGGTEFVEQSTLACALDRLTLLSAGSEPKVGALFAQAELNRSYCGQRDPILAATPKYHLLWKALANRQETRRAGRGSKSRFCHFKQKCPPTGLYCIFTNICDQSGPVPGNRTPLHCVRHIEAKVEDPMKLKVVTAAIALVGALALPTIQADAQTSPPKKRTVVYNNRDNTVQISRDEDGRTRTRVIIQKRSFLDPGTETFPGERVGNTGYVQNPTQTAGSVIDNTSAGLNNRQSPLPGPFTLPSKNNPWLQY